MQPRPTTTAEPTSAAAGADSEPAAPNRFYDIRRAVTPAEDAALIRQAAARSKDMRPPRGAAAIAAEILAERVRQIGKGYDARQDDHYIDGELASGAACYALASTWRGIAPGEQFWSFGRALKSEGQRANLVKAAGMILAELARIDRIAEIQIANHVCNHMAANHGAYTSIGAVAEALDIPSAAVKAAIDSNDNTWLFYLPNDQAPIAAWRLALDG